MNRSFSLLLGLTIFCSAVTAQSRGFSDTAAKLNALLQGWNTATPGGVLTVDRGGTILYNKAQGMADLDHHVAITPETIFEAGSVSKQFTATAVLLLVEDGKISVEDDIRKYIPELPDYGTPIKIKHLLVHTSGLKDWGSVAVFGGWPRGTRAYTQDHAREIIFRQKTLNFTPGSEYSYSNSNYTLLSTLVERVSGQSLVAFTTKRIIEPVGMRKTQWRDDFRKIVSGRAIAYSKRGNAYAQDMPFENTHGHAALLTTTQDLRTWLRYWADGKFGKQLAALRERQGILNNGSTIGYAEGAVRIFTVSGVREVSHSGATAGYRAWLAYYPSKDLSVIYLSNDGSTIPTSQVGKKVTEIFFGKEDAPPASDTLPSVPYQPDVASFAELAGKYYSEEADAMFTVKIQGDTVVLFRSPSTNMRLRAISPDTFEAANGMNFRFIRDRRKKVTSFAASVERAQNVIFNKLP
ncbi:MAG TPA: serine hydrolase domain-containing protein [Chitinophagaceae bacterium]|nr:serine hydrolase domain-containing protein [Chitinophagaceae bacterium]